MNLGLLPGLGGGLKTTAASGQVERFIRYYLEQYAAAFEQIFYFTYHRESLADYTHTDELLRQVQVVRPVQQMHYRLYTLRMASLAAAFMQRCQVLRVFQATGALPAIMARRRYGLPFVMTYGYKYHAFARIEGHPVTASLLRVGEPWVVKRAAAVIVTTPELQQYVARFVSPDRIHLIPNGVDTQLFAPGERAEDADEIPTILFVGRLSPQKNLPQLLEAVARLETPVQLKLIGEGPLRHSLAAQAEQLGVRVDFLGVVPHQELPAHLQRATMFVLPSLAEGHPKALIEAMSCGRPCVASDSEGNRQLIKHGKTGLLFDIGNTHSLAQAITEMITNRSVAQALGKAARQYIKGYLDIYNLLQQEINLLQRVAGTR